MLTSYSHINSKEQLLEILKNNNDFISSIVDNTAFIMSKCIDVDENNLIVFDANSATVLGLFNKQYNLFKGTIVCFKNESFGISSILQRILYETYLKMRYLIKYGEDAQAKYRLSSYINRYRFYIEYNDKLNGYFKVRNDKFLMDLKHDGFTIDDIKFAEESKIKAFGGKKIRQLVAEFDDDILYSSLYGISSDSIHSDWGDIHSLYLRANNQEKEYVANIDFKIPVAERYLITLCQLMLDSTVYYINWASPDTPHLSCFTSIINELKRISCLYSELVLDEYNNPNSKYYTE